MNVHRRRRPLIYLIPNTSRLTSAPTSVSGVVLPSLRPPSVVDTIYSGSVVSPRLTVSFTSSRSLPTPTSVRWTLWVPRTHSPGTWNCLYDEDYSRTLVLSERGISGRSVRTQSLDHL